MQRLRTESMDVVPISSHDGDIAVADTLIPVADSQVSHVIHLAGRTFVPDAWREPAEFQRVNLGGTMNVLEFCRKHGAALTYVSAYLYGEPSSLPVREAHELKPNNPYALSKCMAESACRFYAEHYGIPVTIVRPFNIYGPGQKAHFLIPEILGQALAAKPIRLKDLKPRRDYLYVEDLVDALMLTLSPYKGLRIYNVGSGYSMCVADIVNEIQAAAGTELPVLSDNLPRTNEIMDVYADITAARDGLGWRPKFEFKDGIKMMIDGARNS